MSNSVESESGARRHKVMDTIKLGIGAAATGVALSVMPWAATEVLCEMSEGGTVVMNQHCVVDAETGMPIANNGQQNINIRINHNACGSAVQQTPMGGVVQPCIQQPCIQQPCIQQPCIQQPCIQQDVPNMVMMPPEPTGCMLPEMQQAPMMFQQMQDVVAVQPPLQQATMVQPPLAMMGGMRMPQQGGVMMSPPGGMMQQNGCGGQGGDISVNINVVSNFRPVTEAIPCNMPNPNLYYMPCSMAGQAMPQLSCVPTFQTPLVQPFMLDKAFDQSMSVVVNAPQLQNLMQNFPAMFASTQRQQMLPSGQAVVNMAAHDPESLVIVGHPQSPQHFVLVPLMEFQSIATERHVLYGQNGDVSGFMQQLIQALARGKRKHKKSRRRGDSSSSSYSSYPSSYHSSYGGSSGHSASGSNGSSFMDEGSVSGRKRRGRSKRRRRG